MVNGWKPLNIVTKHSSLDIRMGSEYASEHESWFRSIESYGAMTCFKPYESTLNQIKLNWKQDY